MDLNKLEQDLKNSKTGEIRRSPPKDPQARTIYNILKGGIGSYLLAKPEELDAAKALGVKLGVYSPRTGRSGGDLWLEGDTVKYQWYGMPGSGSLFGIMAPGNVECVNSLSLEECWAVLICTQRAPWHSDKKAVYQAVLASVRDGSAFVDKRMPENTGLGEFRMLLVKKAADGINAPTDQYLRVATGKE